MVNKRCRSAGLVQARRWRVPPRTDFLAHQRHLSRVVESAGEHAAAHCLHPACASLTHSADENVSIGRAGRLTA